MKADQIPLLMRWCRGRDHGAGRFVKSMQSMMVEDDSLTMVCDEIYARPTTAVAFHAVCRSMAFGDENLTTFEQCVNDLGAARVRRAALAGGFLAAMPERKNYLYFNYAKFQRRCLFIACALESLAQRMDCEIVDDAFVAGLIMDGSYLLLLEFFEQDFELSLFTRMNNPDMPAITAEDLHIGFNHCDVAVIFGQDVHLRQPTLDGLRYHHDPSDYSGKHQLCVDLCHLVSVTADMIGLEVADRLPVQKLDMGAVSRLAFDEPYKGHIREAVEYAVGISRAAVEDTERRIAYVRRYG